METFSHRVFNGTMDKGAQKTNKIYQRHGCVVKPGSSKTLTSLGGAISNLGL